MLAIIVTDQNIQVILDILNDSDFKDKIINSNQGILLWTF